jgi:hypothetical protein
MPLYDRRFSCYPRLCPEQGLRLEERRMGYSLAQQRRRMTDGAVCRLRSALACTVPPSA